MFRRVIASLLAVGLSLAGSQAAKAVETSTFAAPTTFTSLDPMAIRSLNSVTLANGNVVIVSAVAVEGGWQLQSFVASGNTITKHVVDPQVFFHFTSIELIKLRNGRVLVGYSAYDHNSETNVATSVLRSNLSADGKAWPAPTAILPQRSERDAEEPVASFGGYQQLKLAEDSAGKIGAFAINKPDTKVTTVPQLQLVTSSDARVWAKQTQISQIANKPVAFEATKVVVSPTDVKVFWQSRTFLGIKQLYYSSSANLAKPVWSAPTSVAPKTATPQRFQVTASPNGNVAATYFDGDPQESNLMVARFSASTKKWLAPKLIDFGNVQRMRTVVEINDKMELAALSFNINQDSQNNIDALQLSASGAQTAVKHIASDTLPGNQLLYLNFDEFGVWNIIYDQAVELAIDVHDEVLLTSSLVEFHGTLSELSEGKNLNSGDNFVEDASVSFDAKGNPNLVYFEYNDTDSILGKTHLAQSRAPVLVGSPTLKAAAKLGVGSTVSVTLPMVEGFPLPLPTATWFACSAKHSAATTVARDCKQIGAGTSFKITKAQKGKYLLALAKALNKSGTASKATATTVKVQ